MHWIDLVILAVIAWTTFAAFRSGLNAGLASGLRRLQGRQDEIEALVEFQGQIE